MPNQNHADSMGNVTALARLLTMFVLLALFDMVAPLVSSPCLDLSEVGYKATLPYFSFLSSSPLYA